MSGRPAPRRVSTVPSPLASPVLQCVLCGLLWIAIGCAEEKPRLRETLGGDLVQALLQLGEVAADLQKAGAKSLPPEQQEQIRGVKALADLAKSGRPPRSPRRKKS